MRHLPGTLTLLVLAASCGDPTIGNPCSASDSVSCKSTSETFDCVGGKWTAVQCGGPTGCADSAAYNCDVSRAVSGTACPSWAQGRQACQSLPSSAILTCVGGMWQQSQQCSGSCSVTRGAPECLNSGSGGGSGTTGGGSGTTGGGSGTTGGGTATTGGGSGTTGGGAATTGGGSGTTGGGSGSECNPGNCSGCCRNGQCFPAPLNTTNDFCGQNGAECANCTSLGRTCDATTAMCISPPCNPSTCPNGCCANGQCFPPPINSSNDYCGTGGNACRSCTNTGTICNAQFSCSLPNTGGGSGTTGGGTGSTGGGAATGGGTGSTGGGTATDPCQGVPVGGECLSSSLVRYCSVPTGTGQPTVQVYACPGGSTCTANGAGASCIQTGACRQGDTRCSGPTTAQTCNSSGNWSGNQACASGCLSTSIGAQCATAATTVNLSGTLRYETRNPNSTTFPTDWGSPTSVPARNVLVLSRRGNAVFDATVTDGNGGYTIKVPQTPTAQDLVYFVAIGGDGFGPRYEVASPGFSQAGEYSPGQTGSEGTWNWSKAVSSLTNGGTTTITVNDGSGALNLYDLLQSIWSGAIANNQGRQGLTMRMWLQFGVEWTCGACFSEIGGEYESEIWMPGGATDQGYWSDYVIGHELGHWQQASYGTAPNEGGTHIFMCPTFPGQAWSEGYATWHSAAVRNRTFLEDKQGGTFFWFDIASRTYLGGSTSQAAINGPGGTNLLAQVDENAVAAMLWHLSNSRPTGSREIFNALTGRHMTTSPWPRQYTRHTWQVGNNCSKTNVVNTQESSPHVADLFDALSCGGNPAQSNRMPQTTIAQTCSSPTTSTSGNYYPYPSASPVCRSGYCYGCVSGSTCNAGNTTAACGTNGVRCVACSSGQTCSNGVCL